VIRQGSPEEENCIRIYNYKIITVDYNYEMGFIRLAYMIGGWITSQ
jgi:hypothetical protein